MKNIAIVLYFVGMLGAIVIGSRYFESDATNKILLNPIFIICALMSTVGCGLWWKARGVEKNAPVDHGDNKLMAKSVKDLVSELIKKVEELNAAHGNLSNDEICDRLENLSETYIYTLVEKKDEIMNDHGTGKGAELRIKLAYSERMMNRAFSCTADGFPTELPEILPLVAENYKESLTMFSKS